MVTVCQTVEVDVDPWEVLDEMEDDELQEELEGRGFTVTRDGEVEDYSADDPLVILYNRFILGQDTTEALRQVFWEKLGKVV